MHQEDDNIVCTMEDLIFIKPGNKVKLEYRKNKYPLEVYVLYIGEELSLIHISTITSSNEL